MSATLALAVIAALALWAGSLYLRPFGPCPKCKGTGHIPRGKRRVKVCPRCKGRRRVQRTGSRAVHRVARKVRKGGKPPPDIGRRTVMGRPDGAHTHGSGGSGLGELLVILLAVALLGPAVAAAAVLLHLVIIVAGVIVGVGATVLAALLAWRRRNWKASAARAMPPIHQKMARAASPLPEARRPDALSSETARELPGGLHLHFHGVSAEDVAAIIARQQEGP